MAYPNPYDYDPVDPATDTWGDAVGVLESNLLAIVHAIVCNGDFLSWDWLAYNTGDVHPPTDPWHPDYVIYTNQENTQQKIKIEYTWSGDKLQTMTCYYSSNGGTSYDAIANTTDTLGKVTMTYSAVTDADWIVIKSEWS